jgi:hypothetical protein
MQCMMLLISCLVRYDFMGYSVLECYFSDRLEIECWVWNPWILTWIYVIKFLDWSNSVFISILMIILMKQVRAAF